jgi:thioredoxin-related protein
MLARKLVFTALILCTAVLHHAAAQGLGSKFDARRDAAADVAQAVARARTEGKRVIVDIGGEWCTWCHILDRFIAVHDDVRSLIEDNFIWVKVNYSPSNKNERLLAAWPRVTGYPHLFVLDGAGRLVRSQATGDLESAKDYDKGKMLAFLQESIATRTKQVNLLLPE